MAMILVTSVALAATIGTSPTQAAGVPTWTAYEANSDDNTVTPINTATNTAGTPLTVGSAPVGIAITPNGATAYVTNLNDGTVTPINTATNTAGSPIPVGILPFGIAITPDGTTAYVAHEGNGTVTPIDTATNTAEAPISVGINLTYIAITPNGSTAYVTDSSANTLIPIDLATKTPGAPIPVGGSPNGLAIAPDGSTVYLANGAVVMPIDTATNTAEAPISVGSNAGPIGIAITPNGATVYVADYSDNTVTPINTVTNTAGTPIPVGSQPYGVAITPNGSTVYVTNYTDNTVTPIDTATNTAGAPIPVGASPHVIAISPDQAPVAHLSVTPASAGQPTTFDASASAVAFGTITSYFWQFGDCVWLCTATTATPTTTHSYSAPGTYTAKVTETDSAGTSRTQIFTGQTMSRNGGASAVASQTFIVGGQALPTIVPGTASVPEPSSGTTTLEVPVTLSAASAQSVTAQWSTLNVPGAPCCEANPVTDYVPTSGTVTFAPGQTSATVPITVNGGQPIASNEYIVLSFTNPTNANMGGYWGLGFGGILTGA